MGELHLEIIKDRIQNHYGVNANMGKIFISYRTRANVPVEEEVSIIDENKQTTTIKIRMEPAEKGSGNSLEYQTLHSLIPKQKVAEVKAILLEGFKSSCSRGIYGYSTEDTIVEIQDIQFMGDINVVSLRKGIARAISNALLKSKANVLEPVMKVEVRVSYCLM